MKYLIAFILFFSFIDAFSQGFDWQYSYRLPYSIPNKFFGVSGGYSVNSSTGNFEFLEDYTLCCNYQSGTGYSIEIGIVYEFWINAMSAITFKSLFNSTNSSFSQTIQIPRSDGINDYITTYNYLLNEKRRHINLSSIYKHRILKSHFSMVAGLNLFYLFDSDATHTEKIISPTNEYFIDGSRERIIKKGMYGDYKIITFNPVIGLNYDYALLKDFYSSISVLFQVPTSNVINNQDWKEWKFQISVTLFKSID